ncbi:acyl-CoA thioesterase [Paenibacillus sp. GCM10023250]|uniref:acyl-CoA thioesterase n=1 Tax=Paenibacillus sp. GCM10023250 TaxID=3252648 RepID=UPI003612A4FE
MTEFRPDYVYDMTVTWGDCDAAGISYYAKTFDWFTNARMGLMAEQGFPYMDDFHRAGISLVCLKADCSYKKMLKPEERIAVHTSLTELTRSRLAFGYRVFKQDGTLAAEGATAHAYVGDDGAPFNLKRRHPRLWDRLTANWPALGEADARAEKGQ